MAAAEYVLIGGGAGLSNAAGLTYGGERFERYFSDYRERYGISDMYAGMFYPFETAEERWAHHARHIAVNRFDPPAAPLYKALYALVRNTDYFVLTTNVESQFEKAGFARGQIFEAQGNYGFLQCAKGCCDKLYGDEETIREMLARTEDFRIPSELLPVCPVCGGALDIHIRKDGYFVQNGDWYAMAANYEAFAAKALRARTVLLELGVGFNTPTIIRFPFEQMVYRNPRALLIRCNREYPDGCRETAGQTVSFSEEMRDVIAGLRAAARADG